MATLHFTRQLGRFMALAPVETDARRLRAGLECAFAAHPRLRSYVLDEHGRLRANVAVFIDGVRNRDHGALDDPLGPDSQVYILQALSGG